MTSDTGKIEIPGRRRVLRSALLVLGATAAAVTRTAPAAGKKLPHLSASQPTAKALMYTRDATTATARKDPKAFCHNCLQFQGTGHDAWGPCKLFPGKAVAANGWCMGWTRKP